MDQHDQTSVSVEGDSHCAVTEVPKDSELIAAHLWYDGYLAVQNPAKFVPITEPFYTNGRPEREAVPGGTCYCIGTGGIPILCDALFDFLNRLGAEGDTAVLIYRGASKKAYDTVQAGFRRFLPSPCYAGQGSLKLAAELPIPLPSVFGIRSTYEVKAPVPRTATSYHVGLSLDSLELLKQSMPRVLVRPLHRTAQ